MYVFLIFAAELNDTLTGVYISKYILFKSTLYIANIVQSIKVYIQPIFFYSKYSVVELIGVK